MKYWLALVSLNSAILLAALTIGLLFHIRGKADASGNPDAAQRFLETPDGREMLVAKRLPSQLGMRVESQEGATPNSTTGSKALEQKLTDLETALRAWVHANPRQAMYYASPLLARYDLFFMLAYGLFMTCAVIALGRFYVVGWLGWSPYWLIVLAAVPLAYIAFDFTEDVLLRRLLTDNSSLTTDALRSAGKFTQLKLLAVLIASVETMALAALGIVHDLRAL